jgi:hypothetical protein
MHMQVDMFIPLITLVILEDVMFYEVGWVQGSCIYFTVHSLGAVHT